MAKRRELKKAINFLCGELFAESVAITLYQKSVKQEEADQVMTRILNLQDDMLRRVSHPEPGMKARAYFDHLRADLEREAEEIVTQIQGLL